MWRLVLLLSVLGATGLVSGCTSDGDQEDRTGTARGSVLEQPPSRCAASTAADCVLAVYRGAPGDYAQVVDIPADVLLVPDDQGRYRVERGEQVTVVTAAQLPSGWTRFRLNRTPLPHRRPSPTSYEQLIPPAGTTYTFTPTEDEAGANLITFDLTAARPRPVRPTQTPEPGDVVVSTTFLVPTLRYDTLDATGAADAAGSYSFLKTAGDATSAVDNFGRSAAGSITLRIHPTDASGTSRAAFYDTVEVGDVFDYRTNGLDCGLRFRVTSVGAMATPWVLGIEGVTSYGGRCGNVVDDPSTARDVEFVWGVRPGLPVAGGVRRLLRGEPTGQGTYRLDTGVHYVIDVPAGMQVILKGIYLASPGPDTDMTAFSPVGLILFDAGTGAVLDINPNTGQEIGRSDTTPAVDDLFDAIMASIRRLHGASLRWRRPRRTGRREVMGLVVPWALVRTDKSLLAGLTRGESVRIGDACGEAQPAP